MRLYIYFFMKNWVIFLSCFLECFWIVFLTKIHHLEALIPIIMEAHFKIYETIIFKLNFTLHFFTKQSTQTSPIHNQYIHLGSFSINLQRTRYWCWFVATKVKLMEWGTKRRPKLKSWHTIFGKKQEAVFSLFEQPFFAKFHTILYIYIYI